MPVMCLLVMLVIFNVFFLFFFFFQYLPNRELILRAKWWIFGSVVRNGPDAEMFSLSFLVPLVR